MKKIILRTLFAAAIIAGIVMILVFVDGSLGWIIAASKKGKSVLPHVIAILTLLVFGPRLWRRVLDRAIHKIKIPCEDESFAQRLETIRRLLLPIGNGAVFFIVLMIALGIFSIDIRPLLAGLGIVGLAVGFGTKNIIEDFGSGIFILWENQYTVGEKVKIGAFEGKVLRLTLRMTFLQGEEGEISIPNRVVANSGVTNQSRKKEENLETRNS